MSEVVKRKLFIIPFSKFCILTRLLCFQLQHKLSLKEYINMKSIIVSIKNNPINKNLWLLP